MELKLELLYRHAQDAARELDALSFGAERLRGAKKYRGFITQETTKFLNEFVQFSDSGAFSTKELSAMLANTCIQTSSFLFGAGAQAEIWRQWCALGGSLQILAEDPAYAMQLLTIARLSPQDEPLRGLELVPTVGYRAVVVQCVIFGKLTATTAAPGQPIHVLDTHYEAISNALATRDLSGLVREIEAVVSYWIGETGYGRYDPMNFPDFEPEINALVAALVMQRIDLKFQSPKSKKFLRAALE